jgi:hypothetical protein
MEIMNEPKRLRIETQFSIWIDTHCGWIYHSLFTGPRSITGPGLATWWTKLSCSPPLYWFNFSYHHLLHLLQTPSTVGGYNDTKESFCLSIYLLIYTLLYIYMTPSIKGPQISAVYAALENSALGRERTSRYTGYPENPVVGSLH